MRWPELPATAPPGMGAGHHPGIPEYLETALVRSPLDLVYDSGGLLSFFLLDTYRNGHPFGVPFVLHYTYLPVRHQAGIAPFRGVRSPCAGCSRPAGLDQ
jgi:hypothetical protein